MLASLLVAFLAVAPPESAPEAPAGARVEEAQAAPEVTEEDAQRLRAHLGNLSASARDGRVTGGILLIGLGAAVAGVEAEVALRSPQEQQAAAYTLAAVLGGGTAALGVVSLLAPSREEQLLDSLTVGDTAGGAARVERVRETERRFRELAVDARTGRLVTGGIIVGLGALIVGGGALLGAAEAQQLGRFGLDAAGLMALGAAYAGSGVYILTAYRLPLERAWDSYTGDPAVQRRLGSGPEVQVGAGPMGRGGFGIALAGRF